MLAQIHPMYRASSALELRSNGGGKKIVHFNGFEQNVHLILRTVISANQFSICGAEADMFTEVSEDTMVSGTPPHDLLETKVITTELPIADPRTDEQRRRNLLQEYEEQVEQLSDGQKFSKLCSTAGLKIVERGQYFLMRTDRAAWFTYAMHLRCHVTIQDLEQEAGFITTRKSAQS